MCAVAHGRPRGKAAGQIAASMRRAYQGADVHDTDPLWQLLLHRAWWEDREAALALVEARRAGAELLWEDAHLTYRVVWPTGVTATERERLRAALARREESVRQLLESLTPARYR